MKKYKLPVEKYVRLIQRKLSMCNFNMSFYFMEC